MQKLLTLFNLKKNMKSSSFVFKIQSLILLVVISSCTTDQSDYTKMNYKLLSDGNGLNKSTFLVKNLKETRDYFADTLGFDIPKVDKFRKGLLDGTITTRINFPGMTSIEFLSIEDSLIVDSPPAYISNFLTNHEGIQQYTLSSSSVDTTSVSYTHLTLPTIYSV